MTQRKPLSMPINDWVERQIRTAEAEQPFAELPLAGKPIPDIDKPRQELGWLADYLRRENVEVAGLLPPALALGKEVEELPRRLVRESSEGAARAVIEELNSRIVRAHAAPQVGPPLRIKLVNVALALDQWRADRAELTAATRSGLEPPPPPVPRRRRWPWSRRD